MESMEPSNNSWWYLDSEGTEVGPVAKSELTNLLASGGISLKTRIYREGMPDWVEAASILTPSDKPASREKPNWRIPVAVILVIVLTVGGFFLYNRIHHFRTEQAIKRKAYVIACAIQSIKDGSPQNSEAYITLQNAGTNIVSQLLDALNDWPSLSSAGKSNILSLLTTSFTAQSLKPVLSTVLSDTNTTYEPAFAHFLSMSQETSLSCILDIIENPKQKQLTENALLHLETTPFLEAVDQTLTNPSTRKSLLEPIVSSSNTNTYQLITRCLESTNVGVKRDILSAWWSEAKVETFADELLGIVCGDQDREIRVSAANILTKAPNNIVIQSKSGSNLVNYLRVYNSINAREAIEHNQGEVIDKASFNSLQPLVVRSLSKVQVKGSAEHLIAMLLYGESTLDVPLVDAVVNQGSNSIPLLLKLLPIQNILDEHVKSITYCLRGLNWQPSTPQENLSVVDDEYIQANRPTLRPILLQNLKSNDPRLYQSAGTIVVYYGFSELIPQLLIVINKSSDVNFLYVCHRSGVANIKSAADAQARRQNLTFQELVSPEFIFPYWGFLTPEYKPPTHFPR